MRDLSISQFYRSCLTSKIHLFDFININKHSRLINSNLLQRSKVSLVEDNEATSDFIKFYAFLELFEGNSGLLQILYRL